MGSVLACTSRVSILRPPSSYMPEGGYREHWQRVFISFHLGVSRFSFLSFLYLLPIDFCTRAHRLMGHPLVVSREGFGIFAFREGVLFADALSFLIFIFSFSCFHVFAILVS